MPICLPDKNLAIFTAPKAGSTSIKQHCHTLLFGAPFIRQRRADGTMAHIHHRFPNPLFNAVRHSEIETLDRFALLRNPVERVLSCHSNRVVFYKQLSEKHLSAAAIAAGAVPDPDLETFIDRLDCYMQQSSVIAHHTRGLVEHFGTEPHYFTRLFRFDQIDALAGEIAARFGQDLPLGRYQDGGQRAARSALRPAQIARIQTLYAKDYAVFGAWLD